MRLTKDFKAGLDRAIDQRLAALGYASRRRGIYVESAGISPFVGGAGWLGLNSTLSNDGIEINPVVGVQHEKLERLLIDLAQETYGVGLPATISSPLGYLKPEKRFEVWRFPLDEDLRATADEMVDAFARFGLPFVNSHRDVAAITEFLESTRTMTPWNVATRLPLALLLAGRPDEAERALGREVTRLGDRGDDAAKQYRHFAQRYRQRFGTEGSPERKGT